MCSKFRESVDLLVLGDQVLLPRRLSVRMSRCGFKNEDILLKGVSIIGAIGCTVVVALSLSPSGESPSLGRLDVL